MMDDTRERGVNTEMEKANTVQRLDDVLRTGQPFRGEAETDTSYEIGFVGSVNTFNNGATTDGGEAIIKDKTAVVNQGSFAFFPDESVSTVLSPDFTRCVGLVVEKPQGLLVAHVTEYDDSLLKVCATLSNQETDRVTFLVPDVTANDVDITDSERDNLKALVQSIRDLAGEKARIYTYPWSDFAPGTGRDDEGYVLKVAKGDIELIHTKTVEDETALGYHHELL